MFPVFKGDFYRFRMKDLKLFSLKMYKGDLQRKQDKIQFLITYWITEENMLLGFPYK